MEKRQPAMYSFYKRALIAALEGRGEYTVLGLLSDMPDNIRDAIIAESKVQEGLNEFAKDPDNYEDYGPTYIWRNT